MDVPHRHLASKRDGRMRFMLCGQWSQHVCIIFTETAVSDDLGSNNSEKTYEPGKDRLKWYYIESRRTRRRTSVFMCHQISIE